MPAPPRIPKYRLHNASGRAVVTIDGREQYLGRYDDPASRARYDRLIAEWLARGRTQAAPDEPLSIDELLAAYLGHAQTYYVKNGRTTSELGMIKDAMRPLRRIFGDEPAEAFGPLKLEVIQSDFVAAGRCRSSVNKLVSTVRRIFKWAVAKELVSPNVWHGLRGVAPLKAGRTIAPEREPVRPVPDVAVDAIRPHVSRQVWTMVELQRATGMRPGEVCQMRSRDIDMGGAVWRYTPESHKTQHHGQSRQVYIGPDGQKLIRDGFLTLDSNRYLFSPTEAAAEIRDVRTARRKTPQRAQTGRKRGRKPPAAGDRYTPASYRRAIARGCDAAEAQARGLLPPFSCPAPGCRKTYMQHASLQKHADEAHGLTIGPLPRVSDIPPAERIVARWHPHQLRHSFATRMRAEHGIEVARVLLGHKQLSATEIYAERDAALAMRIAGGETAGRPPHPHAGKASVRLSDTSDPKGA